MRLLFMIKNRISFEVKNYLKFPKGPIRSEVIVVIISFVTTICP